jgi:hypothetical protein
MRPRTAAAAALVTVAVAGVLLWHRRYSGDEREVRASLASLAEEFNASTTDGLGTVARAVELGSYFAEDVVVDLGPGSGPIEGRLTLIGMAERLQPRTSAFRVTLDDVGVEMGTGNQQADVTLTAIFTRRSITTGEQSVDAREFALAMRKTEGRWRIERATAIDALR